MEVTDFWRSLGNSLLITVITVVLSVLIHSLMGYAIGRNKGHSKFYKFVYLFIVSGMFVPLAILMMPLAKQTAEMGRGKLGRRCYFVYCLLHADERFALFRLPCSIFPPRWREAAC